MRTYLFLFMTAILFASGCEEDNNSKIQSDKIQLGIITDLLINVYDTVLISGYNDFKSIELDIDRDNSPDYAIISEYWGSPLLGEHKKSKILCLNSKSQIVGYIGIDTTYLNFQTDTLYEENMVYIYNSKTYSCSRINENDSILEVIPNQFKILPKREGEYINKTDIFNTDTLTIVEALYKSFDSSTTKNDTLYNNLTKYHNYCGLFLPDVIQYIGIKIRSANTEKLGWIKLSISDNYKISIMECASQK